MIFFLLHILSCLTVCRVSHSGRRNSRSTKNNPSLVVINPSHEYEVMNKEPGAPSCLAATNSSQVDFFPVALCRKTSPLPSRTFIAPLPTEDTTHVEIVKPAVRSRQVDEDCQGTTAEQRDSIKKHQLTWDSESENNIVDNQGQAVQGIGKYEYMDIRYSDSTEEEDQEHERHGCQTSAKSAAETDETDGEEENQVVEVSKKEYKEEEENHCTNKQPTLKGNLSSMVMPRPDVLTAGAEKVEEYEEMTRFGVVSSGWEQADYQNLPGKGRAVSEDVGSGRCAGIREYIKVCASMGEPSNNTSFDNPDYWHSRLFLKPDAVRT